MCKHARLTETLLTHDVGVEVEEGVGRMKTKTIDGFEQREILSDSYWKDPRWKIVSDLRKQEKHAEANGLVFQIRSDWGVD